MRRHSYAGACVSLCTGCMVGLVRRRIIDGPSGWLTAVTPQPETTSGTLPLGRFIPMHLWRLCTYLCRYGRHFLSEIICLTLGPPLLPVRVACPCFPLTSGFWVCSLGSRRQGTQLAPHRTPAV